MEPAALASRLMDGRDLTRDQARGLFDEIMDGRVEADLLARLLTALAAKGETVAELVGAAEAMRRRATPVRLPPGVAAIDTCGTGGDGKPTFNVSTAVAIVAAAAGATVAKHGNRSNARPSGSAEGLAALGIDVEADVGVLERCLRECRIAFLYAPRLHPAMRHAAAVRQALGTRTIFNLLGPLTNPAAVRRQLVGVSRVELVDPMMAALRELGTERALVVCGLEGLCDLSPAGPSRVARWDGRALTVEEIGCDCVGVAQSKLEDLFVRSPAESANRITQVLAGQPGPARDTVVFNSAAALWVAGLAESWSDGARLARAALDNGSAADTLARWRACSCSAGLDEDAEEK